MKKLMSLLMIIILGSLFITGCYDNKKRVITEKEQKIIDEYNRLLSMPKGKHE